MSRRGKILTYGSAGLCVLAGALCAVLVPGLTGQLLTLALMSVGFAGAALLVFYEIGLSEDRERAAAAERKLRTHERPGPLRPLGRLRPRAQHRPRWPRRPS